MAIEDAFQFVKCMDEYITENKDKMDTKSNEINTKKNPTNEKGKKTVLDNRPSLLSLNNEWGQILAKYDGWTISYRPYLLFVFSRISGWVYMYHTAIVNWLLEEVCMHVCVFVCMYIYMYVCICIIM